MGEGNALKFIKELDFTKYAGPIKGGAHEVVKRLGDGIDFVRNKFGRLIPDAALRHMAAIKHQLIAVGELVDKMIPQALKDLNNRLKYIQRLAYQGEWHLIPGAGKAVTRETEARLVHDALLGKEVWKVEGMRWPQNPEKVFVLRDGWPDLGKKTVVTPLTNGKDLIEHNFIAAFSGPITARELRPGTTLYRVVAARDTSKTEGVWWMATDPKSITGWYWRVKYAVCESWNTNGKYAKYVVKDKPLHAWEGKVSSQIDQSKLLHGGGRNNAFGQYLEGGETQLYIDFTHASNAHAVAEVKALPKLDTNWIDHMDVNIPQRRATVQKLGTFVEEQKSLASANLATAANEANHGVQAARSR